MLAAATAKLNVWALRTAFRDELETRRCRPAIGAYANARGGGEELYGVTGAVHVRAALGLPMGTWEDRRAWSERILSYRRADGTYPAPHGVDEHAFGTALSALHLLGWADPCVPPPLAPLDPKDVPAWLAQLDGDDTHKAFCGAARPVLASGLVSSAWIEALVRGLRERLCAQPPRFWCPAGAPPWKVISCLYHVLTALDAGCVPYPEPEKLWERLIGLRWEDAEPGARRTVCTDGDWAWLLLRLGEHLPHRAGEAVRLVRKVSARRVEAWHADPESWLNVTTHELYCELWSTAVFQSAVREDYEGPYLRDTLNDPALFRLVHETPA